MDRAHNYYSEDGDMCHNFFGRGIIEKISFFYFGGPQKLFLTPKTLIGLRNPYLRGVIVLKLFDPSIGLGVGNVKIATLGQNQPWLSLKP